MLHPCTTTRYLQYDTNINLDVIANWQHSLLCRVALKFCIWESGFILGQGKSKILKSRSVIVLPQLSRLEPSSHSCVRGAYRGDGCRKLYTPFACMQYQKDSSFSKRQHYTTNWSRKYVKNIKFDSHTNIP